MVYSYFPGCTLRAKARGFESSTLASCKVLGVCLEELEEWQCCGAAFPLQIDNSFPLVSPTRALISAKKAGRDLVTLCSACLNVLKRTNHVMRADLDRREKVCAFIEEEYSGEVEILHLLEVLRDRIGFEALARKVVVPLSGLSVAAYYGCLLLRPPEEVGIDDPEAPTILEEFLSALGCDPVDYPYKTECCGSYVLLQPGEAALSPSRLVVESAKSRGAQVIVTSCPLCQFNLDYAQSGNAERMDYGLPVLYFTQLLAIALGLGEESLNFEEHIVPPGLLFQSVGVLGCGGLT
ncbi:MAG: CoB--CoM heterodisulfide reductase iron-sulfur subunit B family protein [Bacillota bacterium]|nr:CoB--CoM heterodisulfide reductase iron-sulfur subunit B family protein [Bacillota bacterium]NLD12540.1 disulfide reductase [Bacillota bacterium]HOB88825.1 CoB--CoM heterodisulfide reductase iron-sulfur subunit B family protein [Bacillota bacterium]HPU61186.1 CoB--CoM heterodisulfide reductase iron-sulfur subunit B family protein [Bacillota bacterium]HPZ92428.1 CoB--CoM heterodisulfide reductase iron-sulfur subunit B family protein [Bacillota bacterium]